MKPTKIRNRTLYMVPLHHASKQLSAQLSAELQEKYRQTSARVIEGDNVKVMRGEFRGIEGKITNVSTEKRGIAIEGIKREKLKGGSVDIYIHPSNVMITNLNLEDKWRQSRLEGQKPKPEKPRPQEQKEVEKPTAVMPESPKPKEKKEEKQVKEKPKQKESKKTDKTEKKEKQTKTTKSKGGNK